MIRQFFKIVKSFAPLQVIRKPPIPSFSAVRYSFCSVNPRPTFEKIMSGFKPQEVDSVLSQISTLTSENKQAALRMIVKGLDNQTLPNSLIYNSTFESQVQEFPAIYIDFKLIKNGLLSNEILRQGAEISQEKITQLYEIISHSFEQCYEKLEKITEEHVKVNYDLYLKRQYSDFFVIHLCKYHTGDPTPELKQCIDIYRHHNEHVSKTVDHLLATLKAEDQQQLDTKYEILGFAHIVTDNILSIIQCANAIFEKNNKYDELFEEFGKIQKDIEPVLSYYKSLEGIDYISSSYINLLKHKAYFDHLIISKDGSVQKGREQLVEDYKNISRTCLKQLSNSASRMAAKSIWDVSLLIVTIKAEELELRNVSDEVLKKQITELVDSILQKTKDLKHFEVIKLNLNKTIGFILQYRKSHGNTIKGEELK